MKRSPLRRITPLRSHSQLARTPLKKRSRKTVSEADQRFAVRMAALAAADYQCEAKDAVPELKCWGPLDVDEVAPRGVRPGGHLDPANVQVLCRAHHEWKHAHPKEAQERGLRRWSWE